MAATSNGAQLSNSLILAMDDTSVELKLIAASSDQPPAASSSASPFTTLVQVELLLPLAFLTIWAILTSVYIGLPKQVHKRLFELKPRQKIRCRSCQFFNSNPYLQCTVHPSVVLTGKAADCADYQSTME